MMVLSRGEVRVSFGIFAWAVRRGILGEADLCANLGRVGALLYQLVGLCHGPGLINVTITAYIRCAICICFSTVCVAFLRICFEYMLF